MIHVLIRLEAWVSEDNIDINSVVVCGGCHDMDEVEMGFTH